ncbi:ASCH domain-containing protein [Staphylococcus caeli]|uniref:ASCH domain-containing protein n=1 Tax=Staphylococcus caeli TaxID=2201815 RepID=UPI003F561065
MALSVEQYWRKFIETFPEYKGVQFEAWSFGINEDELADLVKKGEKTATTSGYETYKVEGEKLPEVGEISVILNEQGNPQCVIQTTRVYQVPFNEVTKQHAFLEGEGDKSLAYWREAHVAFFKPYYASLDIEFNETSMMVCEEFKVLYA